MKPALKWTLIIGGSAGVLGTIAYFIFRKPASAGSSGSSGGGKGNPGGNTTVNNPNLNVTPPPSQNNTPPVYTPTKHFSIPTWKSGSVVYSLGGAKWYPSGNKIGGSNAPSGNLGTYIGMSNDGKFAKVFGTYGVKFIEKSGNTSFYQMY